MIKCARVKKTMVLVVALIRRVGLPSVPAKVPGSAGFEQWRRALAGWLKPKPRAFRAKQAQPSCADPGTVRLP